MNTSTKSYVWSAIGAILFFIGMVYVNYLSTQGYINGTTPKSMSDLYYNLFTPASFTFLIWSVIYVSLAVFLGYTLYQTYLNPNLAQVEQLHKQVVMPFVLTCILNVAWLYAWHHNLIGVALVIMLTLLATLTYINMQLRSVAPTVVSKQFLKFTFGTYMAWILVATVANISALLTKANWDMFGIAPQYWLGLILVVVALLGSFFINYFNNISFGFVLVWALFGIFMAHYTNGNQSLLMLVTNIGSMLLVAAMTFLHMSRRVPTTPKYSLS